jgi:hypothetical protein
MMPDDDVEPISPFDVGVEIRELEKRAAASGCTRVAWTATLLAIAALSLDELRAEQGEEAATRASFLATTSNARIRGAGMG